MEAVDPDTLMVTAGNSQAISHAALAFAKTNKCVFVETPTYFLAHEIFHELGLDVEEVHMGESGIDVRGVLSFVCLFVCLLVCLLVCLCNTRAESWWLLLTVLFRCFCSWTH